MTEQKKHDPEEADLLPETTGSLGEQELGEPTELIIPEPVAPEVSHLGALLMREADSEQLLNRAVAFAALKDADASRRFLETQLESEQDQNTSLREQLQTKTTRVAVLEQQIGYLKSARWSKKLSFGIGAAVFGAGVGIALTSSFALLHAFAIGLGLVLMVVGAADFGRGED